MLMIYIIAKKEFVCKEIFSLKVDSKMTQMYLFIFVIPTLLRHYASPLSFDFPHK